MKFPFNLTYAATDGDTRRRVVTAEWPTAMVAFNDYVGVEFSVLDIVAPLAELALRPSGSFTPEKYVAVDAFRPRIGLWFAVPQFSRRLALSSGFAGRFLDVQRIDDGTTPTLSARYEVKPSLVFDAGLQFVFWLMDLRSP